jgi:dienelactone hydrolase
VLAEQLAEEGLVSFQVDYDGTGDSAGWEEEPGRAEAWERSVVAAVEFLRAGGARHVSLVGMRLGANLAAAVSAECKPDALVLWDPCDSGRSYLREQEVLRSVYETGPYGPASSADAPDGRPGSLEVLGTIYAAETVRAMSELDVGLVPDALEGSVLALLRPEKPPRRAVLERLSALKADLAEAPEQDRMLDMRPDVFVPHGTVATIVAWLERTVGPERSPVNLAVQAAAVVQGPGGGGVVERTEHLGPNKLFGIVARPEGQTSGPTIVLLNAGTIDHTGPGRLWAQVARSWAEAGLQVVRVDLSGRGDSPARPGQPLDVTYSAEALDDVADIVQALSPGRPSDVVLLGLCSGAYHAVRAGADLGTGGVLAINPIFTGRLSDVPTSVPAQDRRGTRPAKAAGQQARSFAHRVLNGADDLFGALTRRLPDELRQWAVNRLVPGPRPALMFKRLQRGGSDTLVICRSNEGREMQRGDKAVFRRLESNGHFHLEVLPGIDHRLFTRAARAQVVQLLTDHVTSHYLQAGGPGGTDRSRAHSGRARWRCESSHSEH